MPSETFAAVAVAAVPRDAAWRALQRSETWEGIAGVEDIRDAQHTPTGELHGFSFAVLVGGKAYQGTARVAAAIPTEHLRLDLDTTEVTATVDVHLRDANGGTEIRIELEARARSFLAGMFFSTIAATIGRGLPTATEDFARRLADRD